MSRDEQIQQIIRLVQELMDDIEISEDVLDVMFVVSDGETYAEYLHNIPSIEIMEDLITTVMEDTAKDDTSLGRFFEGNSLN